MSTTCCRIYLEGSTRSALHCESYFHCEPLGNKDVDQKSEEAMGRGALDDGSGEEK